MAVIYPFMQGLREAAFPAPGRTVTLKSFIPDSGTEVGSKERASLMSLISALPFTGLAHREMEPSLGTGSWLGLLAELKIKPQVSGPPNLMLIRTWSLFKPP